MTGKPTAEGYQDFVTYGENATLSNIGMTGLGTRIERPWGSAAVQILERSAYYV